MFQKIVLQVTSPRSAAWARVGGCHWCDVTRSQLCNISPDYLRLFCSDSSQRNSNIWSSVASNDQRSGPSLCNLTLLPLLSTVPCPVLWPVTTDQLLGQDYIHQMLIKTTGTDLQLSTLFKRERQNHWSNKSTWANWKSFRRVLNWLMQFMCHGLHLRK